MGHHNVRTLGNNPMITAEKAIEIFYEREPDGVQQIITENWNDITKLPQDVKCLNAHDFAFTRYKYLDFKCGGYAIEVAEEGEFLLKYERKIRKIFKKYGLKF